MQLFNTLARQKEKFVSLEPGKVRMYTCGPTVYRFIHIGNLRAFLTSDFLRRALMAQGYEVLHVKNITDVGHMRQDMVERGGDKMILAALAAGRTSAEIAQFYTEAFYRDEERVNILPAQIFPRATEHVGEMIQIVRSLVDRGLAYEVNGNVYFDVGRFPPYGSLSGNAMQSLLDGVRVEAGLLKRNQVDFTLWKAAEEGRELKWESPWGPGFPGWHIECSAMSIKYLGEEFDIHTGGVDNIFPHHEDEIAQSEGTLGHQVVHYWVHCQHLLADGLKMAKSTGNSYTLAEMEQRGFEPLAFRYLCLMAHYRRRMNFTFPALIAAQSALERLRRVVVYWARSSSPDGRSESRTEEWRRRFWEEVNDDLNMPRALAVLWDTAKSDLPTSQKLDLITDFDQVLGLDLLEAAHHPAEIPAVVAQRERERTTLRQQADYPAADTLREEVRSAGFKMEDTRQGAVVRPLEPTDSEGLRMLARAISGSGSVVSHLEEPASREISIVILAHDYAEDVQRCVTSALQWLGSRDGEVIVVENGTTGGLAQWLEELKEGDSRVQVLHADHALGEGTGKNVAFKQAVGRHIIVLDISVGVVGDVFSPITAALADDKVGLVGRWGLRSYDLRHFDEVEESDVDAMQAYCFAFRRADLLKVGLLDEKFRFYRNLDIDMSLQFRAQGFRILALPDLPLERFEHKLYLSLAEEEMEKQSQKNFNRVLHKWQDRASELLLHYDPELAHAGQDHDD